MLEFDPLCDSKSHKSAHQSAGCHHRSLLPRSVRQNAALLRGAFQSGVRADGLTFGEKWIPPVLMVGSTFAVMTLHYIGGLEWAEKNFWGMCTSLAVGVVYITAGLWLAAKYEARKS